MTFSLFGFKNAGKTHFGKLLSQRLSLCFIDIDEEIKSSHQMSVRELYKQIGETAFRKVESSVILSIRPKEKTVLSLGGGSVLNPDVVSHLKALGPLIYLKVRFETAKQRGLPAFLNLATYESRLPIYERVADKTIDVDTLTEEQALQEIINGL
jgi:shikimate kinase